MSRGIQKLRSRATGEWTGVQGEPLTEESGFDDPDAVFPDCQPTTRPPWKKLLWVKQDYPDNYVDSSFLSQLRRNDNVAQYSFRSLFLDSSVIIMHLCTIVVFVVVFLGIFNHEWDPEFFAIIASVLTVPGYFVYEKYKIHNDDKSRPSTIKGALLIVFVLLALSPVLKSLTRSTSSDSIWAIACWLGLANVCFHDYTDGARTASGASSLKLTRPILSTNLAMLAAIVLASQLRTTMAVFCFVLFSVILFGVFPMFTQWCRATSRRGYWVLLSILLILSATGLYVIGGLWALGAWIGVKLFVSVGAPLWLLALQKYKNDIQGPWDIAKPVIRNRP
ncbi:phosphatidylinositol N-acetylglucosaminyltransferase subunit C [Yarrowia lipolytica]|uniref:YALI0B14223p n=2 Tax=Yarrowia lipolytica TaxID=4952 RepID=Q6CEN8_YARLI|nr:YALI0B14223p [Yarrowia lipolytica CLIB122]AOW01683.1 hypothetical protein YALI1_B18764g [Yarrowia lipolytica]KAB8284925.1 phosphatidylinositol N-acetylglucosaminyltransferase subunit C [Yarrowia lipolytica]KAE8175149.1 phosphatidylinositol N-acetylglucosaminyltransferase subunit C [Yarrowia lipolytica]KAJ8052485.1 phosphatidylinositol N-acetylglucosaminyltransferase subunit C [Yarrowia lipolytica]QNP96757.1 Phosphatidylinositol N-acetylglucosaminyltransferase GPI2 subunit [Yarrowia lipolyti|eukprot:XP_500874.1 YALI0B14223p [Yarrowia lipolytica CLIB122]